MNICVQMYLHTSFFQSEKRRNQTPVNLIVESAAFLLTSEIGIGKS
ncbi:MAG: hypothetical protein OZ915_10300 [Ignavibacteriales bacterium]|jgi:hypothetical protein|nr:hypothetical protein [Ignavibacteriaceae bacterium]MEB2355556.1 hypothetical protein [Ignavibacteriales bacterium]